VKARSLNKSLIILTLLMPLICVSAVSITIAFSLSSGQAGQDASQSTGTQWDRAFIALSAGIVVGLACLGAGMAISATGTAAISASVEKPETFFRSFLVVALAEALAIYGLIIGILLWLKL
jgi:V/A-type H+-transporting ATPase subunit K